MIIIKIDGAVTTLILDRLAKRNALTKAMITSLRSGVATAEADENCLTLVITGAKGYFAIGRELSDEDRFTALTEVMAYENAYTAVFEMRRRSAKPSIAIFQGYTVAGGFTLAMGCDFVIAERSAVLGCARCEMDCSPL